MKLLLLGDSHCRELTEIFAELSSTFTVYTVFVPHDITSITLKYRSKLQTINAYRSDVILIHLNPHTVILLIYLHLPDLLFSYLG